MRERGRKRERERKEERDQVDIHMYVATTISDRTIGRVRDRGRENS